MELFSGSFLRQLKRGDQGAAVAFPRSFEVLQKAPGGVFLADPEHHVVWHAAHSQFRLDLRPANDKLLQRDIERAARHTFDEEYQRFEAESAAKAEASGGASADFALAYGPRTADPEWSPLVQAERVEVDSSPGLRVIHRIAYQPLHEIIWGHLLVPLSHGTMEFSAIQEAQETGVRESLLWSRRVKDTDPAEIVLTQPEIDDPENDTQPPFDSLSCVRMALAWLTDPNGAGLKIRAPAAAGSCDEVALPEVGFAIQPPPRYVRVKPPLNLRPDICLFSRISLPDTQPWLLDLLRFPEVDVSGSTPAVALEQLATAEAEAWANDGCTEIKSETTILEPYEVAAQVDNYITYSLFTGQPARTAARWLLMPEGDALRITCSGPPFAMREEMRQVTEDVTQSLRRLTAHPSIN